MKKYFFASFLLIGSTQALLPPLYETLHQFQGLLDSPELTKKLESGEAIESIDKNEDVFTVTTNKHTLKVTVKSAPQAQPGPGHYLFDFGFVETR